ncbi:hypothetical protein C8R46DRAFT_927066 [Mycena filopes]|nr:hypothetical protein C8R46DRAFT_927066 [Mycena filopes]
MEITGRGYLILSFRGRQYLTASRDGHQCPPTSVGDQCCTPVYFPLPGILLQIWWLTEQLWKFRYHKWPKLNWGLLLGCGLAKFKSSKGKPVFSQNCFFTVIVSLSMKLIWDLRNWRVFDTLELASETEIHNRWVSMVNSALRRDILLTNRARFGSLSIKKQLVLNTWSGTLLDEDSLPDDWIKSEGVLVGIRPITRKNGVG